MTELGRARQRALGPVRWRGTELCLPNSEKTAPSHVDGICDAGGVVGLTLSCRQILYIP